MVKDVNEISKGDFIDILTRIIYFFFIIRFESTVKVISVYYILICFVG